MKVTLDKNIQLHTAIVYLRFEKELCRKDIQEYLKGKQFDNSLIENRVKDYLKNIKVFDEKYQLTALGNSVKDSGMLPTVEEGKYQIWFSDRDSYFGNKIFYFKRVQPTRGGSDGKLQLWFGNEDHFYLPTETNSFSNLKLLPMNDYFGQNISYQNPISLRWTWENLEKSSFVFDGQLGKGENVIKLKQKSIPCQEQVKDLIEQMLSNWDKDSQRLKIPFEELSEQSRMSFEHNLQTKWNDFEVNFQSIPLKPYNKEDAAKWRNCLVNENLKKDYLSPSDFENRVIEINEKDGFKSYSQSLDIPKSETFSSIVKKDALAFWHLNAPLDLNPNTKVKLNAKPIELRKDSKISFREIVAMLGFESFENISLFVYYDRYVININQQKSVDTLFSAVDCKNKIVVTDLTPKENSSDFIQKNQSAIKLKDCKTIFKSRFPHDRYIVFGNNEELRIWNISNSIDYITFLDKNIDRSTKGTIRQSVVFTPVSKEMLDKDLLNFIQNEIRNGK
ncbi:MAG: hypothetical protein R2799_00040 [Crocinitomicaceae bacterium]